MMLKKYVFLFLISGFSVVGLSQSEDESCLPPSKKTQKLLDVAMNSSDLKTAVDNFNAAMALEADNATVYFDFAMFSYNLGLRYFESDPNPAKGNRSFAKAEELFEKTIELCPDFHADCYYYLGVINFSQDDKETAIKWFKDFKNFKNSDNSRYPADYDKKLSDVNAELGEMQSELDLLNNKVPFEPKIVQHVSSDKDEYFPMISPDNELIFYTRKVNRAEKGSMISNMIEEFTYSQRPDISSLFDNGTSLKPPFNDGTFTNYGSATVSVDNKEMIICACKKEQVSGQDYLNCDLYSTTYERSGEGGNDFVWTPLKNLGTDINTPDGWEAQPTLSADGNTMYYTVMRPTSRDNDIYVAERQDDGSWGNVRPFDEINTDGKDKSPFLHQDSETLYFVSSTSDKRKGVGGTDIYYIRKENGKWSEPKNIGYPINTAEDEIGLFVSADGHTAYYSSRLGGNWNIYSFDLYEEARPKAVAIIKGELKDDNGEPVQDATIEIAYAGTDEVTTVKVNGNDGKYAAVVKTDIKQDVMVTVKKEGYAFDSKLIEKDQLATTKDISLRDNDLNVKELRVGEAYTINDILYATNSAELSARSKFILKSFARFLKENPTIQVAIQGHTDDVGDDKQNLWLSESRAKGVRDYLVSLGISASRMTAKGYGETMPKVENDSDENRAKNRRTDFVIVSM